MKILPEQNFFCTNQDCDVSSQFPRHTTIRKHLCQNQNGQLGVTGPPLVTKILTSSRRKVGTPSLMTTNSHLLKRASREPLLVTKTPHIPKRAIWEAPMLTKYPQFLMLGAPIGNEKSSLPQKARSEKFGNLMFPPKMYPGLIF